MKETFNITGIILADRKSSDSRLNFELSYDAPLITKEIIESLVNAYTEGIKAVVCNVGSKVLSLIALYHRNCKGVCERLLEKDEGRMMQLMESLEHVSYLSLNKQQTKQLKNINSKTDLNEIRNAG